MSACSDPCAGGCDLSCERRVAWKPDPRKQHPGIDRLPRGESMRFLPNGKGGGFVQIASLDRQGRLGIWKTITRKRPMLAPAGQQEAA